MKAATLKLCLPVVAMTAQQTAVSLVIPPFLHDLKYPVSAIGSLISVGPMLALAARLPSGLAYRRERARLLMVAALSVLTVGSFLYSFAVEPLYFAIVHGMNGFAFGAATTIYLAFYVEALPPGEDRRHAMGYYAGCLAVGYSSGGFAAGYIADRLGYTATFGFGALLGLLCLAMLLSMRQPAASAPRGNDQAHGGRAKVLESLKSVLDPNIASIVIVALFLNLLHQMGNVFLPLYGLAVGLTLTEVGAIRGFYSLCNAITRPLSGLVANRVNTKLLFSVALPLQSLFLTLVPLFHSFGPVLTLFILGGFMRAVAIVSNAISLVEDIDESRVSKGMASGLYNAAGDVGNILGPGLGGLLASLTGITRLFFVGPPFIVAFFFASLWGCRFFKTPRRS